MYTLQNDQISISVQNQGAELCSLYHKSADIEHIWQADPKIWPWHAPILFPIVGRCLNDEYSVNGKSYKLDRHGFARKSNFELISSENNRLKFCLKYSDETLNVYPYLFDFQITYELNESSVIQTLEVVNEGNEDMYFSIGGHPAFNAPFLPNEEYEDYYLEFNNDTELKRWHIDKDGFFDLTTSPIIMCSNTIALRSDMFRADAIIIKDIKSRTITLKSTRNKKSLSVDFDGFNYIGLWAKLGARYVCIEPWLGCADTLGESVTLDKKEGIQTLAPGDKFQASIIISVS
jgi:galactose mutarotase-like enzyme